MLNFTLDGQDYEFDETSMLVHEAREIKKHAGLGLISFAQGLRDGDPDALVALLYLSKRRSGVACRWKDFDNVDLNTLDIGVAEDEESEEVAPLEDPTSASSGGKTPKK